MALPVHPVAQLAVPRKRVRLAIAHDYLTARGGAERFLVSLMSLYPQAPIYTSLFNPADTYPEFARRRIIPSDLNKHRRLRENYRASLPLLPRAFGRLEVDADVVLCSSSGWSHGIASNAPKIVYCHNPARWLYQQDEYVRGMKSYLVAARTFKPFLVGWDKRAAASCARYLANSRAVAERIRRVYGIDAEVLPPPTSLDPHGPQQPIEGLSQGYFLSVGRLLGYKNVDALLAAFGELGPSYHLVVAGDGPLSGELRHLAGANITFVGDVSDAQLRWLYANCTALLSAADEDFGLTPVEAGLFGKPCGLIRKNGFIDTTIPGETGLFFEELKPKDIAQAVQALERRSWDAEAITLSADRFSVRAFRARLDQIVDEVLDENPIAAAVGGQ